MIKETIRLTSSAPDLNAPDAPPGVWNSVNNVVFRNGETVRTGGDEQIMTGQLTTPRVVQYTEIDGDPYWVYAGMSGIYVYNGATHSDITPAGWVDPPDGSIYTACLLSGVVVINISSRDPVYWDGSTSSPCVTLPDWPENGRCNAMRSHKGFLFAIGMVSENSSLVRWSDAAEPGTVPSSWTPAADNLAGSAVLSEGIDQAVDGATLRNSFIIYKQLSVWRFDLVQSVNVVFRVTQLFSDTGCRSTNAITGDWQKHIWMDATSDLMMTDGTSVRSVLDGKAQRTLAAEIDENPLNRISCAILKREKLIYMAYPTRESEYADRIVFVDLSSGDVGFRDAPQVICMSEGRYVYPLDQPDYSWDNDTQDWNDDTSSWSFSTESSTSADDIIGGYQGGFLLFDEGDSYVTGPVNAYAVKYGIAFGNPDRRKVVQRIWPKVRGQQGQSVMMRVGASETPDGTVTWTDKIPYIVGGDEPIDVLVAGRYLAFEVSTNIVCSRWTLSSFDVTYTETGRW